MKKAYFNINADCTVAIGAAPYAYTAINGTENIELREFSLLDIVPQSLGVLVKSSALCRFVEKGS